MHLILGNHDHLNLKEKGLFVTVSDLKHIKTVPRIILSHRPLQSWEPSKLGRIHLHGHCHGRLEKSPLQRLDLSDPAWECTPISFDEIFNIFYCGFKSKSEIGK